MVKLGIGGPGLSSAAFTAGVATISTAIEDANKATIQFHTDRGQKTFSEKFGLGLATRLHRMCDVADDAHLPAIHGLLVGAPKSREHAKKE